MDIGGADFSAEGLSATHRLWVIPLLEALRSLGGTAAPRDVLRHIRQRYREQITVAQLATVIKNKHIEWTRLELRTAGLIDGEYAQWRITDIGRRYLESHSANTQGIEKIDFSRIPPLEGAEDHDIDEVETVKATGSAGYEILVLRVLNDGYREPKTIVSEIAARFADQLLPGDYRTLPRGSSVHSIRINSTIGKLKSLGQARSLGHGQWEITDTGRQRLSQEGETWSPKAFQNTEAKVRALKRAPGIEPAGRREPILTWQSLSDQFPEIHRQLDRRLRPDLGPTPVGRPIERNAILYGPPGTGKTFVAKLAARALTGDKAPGPESAWRIVQFHPSYAYEDFVQGLRPNLEQRGARFELRPGPFLDICSDAESDPDRFYVLVIDEINRGDPSRIFGELLYSIEYRGEPVDLALGGQLTIPPNLILLGTMNSVDRSVALVDYALRRRFGFVRVDPRPEVIEELRAGQPMAPIAATVLQALNDWLVVELDRDHVLGHSYFLNAGLSLETLDALEAIFDGNVRPLLEEYFYGDAARMNEGIQVWRRSLAKAIEEEKGER